MITVTSATHCTSTARCRQSFPALPMSVSSTTFHPAAAGIERLARKAYGATMRGLGIVPFPVLAQGARFWVDTVDYIDQCLAFDGM